MSNHGQFNPTYNIQGQYNPNMMYQPQYAPAYNQQVPQRGYQAEHVASLDNNYYDDEDDENLDAIEQVSECRKRIAFKLFH